MQEKEQVIRVAVGDSKRAEGVRCSCFGVGTQTNTVIRALTCTNARTQTDTTETPHRCTAPKNTSCTHNARTHTHTHTHTPHTRRHALEHVLVVEFAVDDELRSEAEDSRHREEDDRLRETEREASDERTPDVLPENRTHPLQHRDSEKRTFLWLDTKLCCAHTCVCVRVCVSVCVCVCVCMPARVTYLYGLRVISQ